MEEMNTSMNITPALNTVKTIEQSLDMCRNIKAHNKNIPWASAEAFQRRNSPAHMIKVWTTKISYLYSIQP